MKDVDYISGAAIMLSKKLWQRLGGFDERFAPAYCEDADLAFAVRKAGYRVVYQPLSDESMRAFPTEPTPAAASKLTRWRTWKS